MVLTANNPTHQRENFIKLLSWNIIKQMKELVACLRSPERLTSLTLFSLIN